MNTDYEQVDKYLKGIVPPEYASAEHRRQLRSEVLARLESGHAGGTKGRKWKIAALVLGLLCAAAAATELAIQVHRF